MTYGKFLTVEEHVVGLPDGRTIPRWPWLITPPYAIVVAVSTEHQVLCFRQVKYAVPEPSLALPGGYLEPDEEPLTAAQRELLEETGHTASAWTPLGTYVVDANRGAGVAHLFLATGAHKTKEPDADDLEEQQLVPLAVGELQEAVLAGRFKALSWTAAAGLALLHLTADAPQ
jgi:ADP-ribose pyrophosphatase